MVWENQMVAEGFSLRIGLQCNTDPETQPARLACAPAQREGCGYQEITARRGPIFWVKSRKRSSLLWK